MDEAVTRAGVGDGEMPGSLLLTLRKFVAPECVFGRGALSLAGRQAAGLGVRRALLVADPGLFTFGWPDKVRLSLEQAGVAVEVFSALSANPRDEAVMAGAAVFLDAQCDALVAVGGGSAMDCAKGIGIVSANRDHILAFEGVDNVTRPGPPLLCVPTTAGTGAEVSQFAIVTDAIHKRKVAIASKALIPDVALIDPDTTVTMPSELTAHSGLDALTHAIEAYVSNAHGPVTDLFAEEAIRLLARHLSRAMAAPEDMHARGGMMLASFYAGLAFSNAILGAVHAMAHSLGGLLDLPHGLCNAVLLDHVVAYNYAAAPARYDRIARLLGATIAASDPEETRKACVVQTLRAFKQAAGVSRGLADFGISPASLGVLALHAASDPCLLTNPRQLCVEEIETIYENACRA